MNFQSKQQQQYEKQNSHIAYSVMQASLRSYDRLPRRREAITIIYHNVCNTAEKERQVRTS